MPKNWRVLLKRMVAVVVVVLTAGYSGVCLGYAYQFLGNTLVNNGRWVSSKEALGIKVMGAPAYTRFTQALAYGYLHLDAWHGYQEVLIREKMPLRDADFDFFLTPDAYFSFVLKTPDGASGIRVSANSTLKNICFAAKNDGEFAQQQEILVPPIPTNQWSHFSFRTEAAGVKILINGAPVDTGAFVFPRFCSPGFRGCERQVGIDNVVFRGEGGFAFEDTFQNMEGRVSHSVYALVLVILLNFAFYYSHHLFRALDDIFAVSWAVFNILIALTATLIVAVGYFSGGFYPSANSLDYAEAAYLYNQLTWRNEEIEAQASARKDNRQGLILFVGSSQTFGAGATTEQETFVSEIQRRLDAATKDGPGYLCVNSGINGGGTPTLISLYEQHWIKLKPDVVVINLCINDRWNTDAEYAANLERFVALNKDNNIRTLFVLEAHSSEWTRYERAADSEELRTHAVMRKVAAALGVPLVDAHAQLKRDADRGFLWWDYVHPTSFGHRLIAEAIFPELIKLIPSP